MPARSLIAPVVYPGAWPVGRIWIGLDNAGKESDWTGYQRIPVDDIRQVPGAIFDFPQCTGGNQLVTGARLYDRFGRTLMLDTIACGPLAMSAATTLHLDFKNVRLTQMEAL